MSFIVTCECGKRFQVRDEQLGKKGQCKGCGRVLVLTPEGQAGQDAAAAAAPAPAAPPGYDPNYGAAGGAAAEAGGSYENPLDNIDWSAVEAAEKDARAQAARAAPSAAYMPAPTGPMMPSTPMAPAMPRQRPCPACGQIISARALRCEFCSAVLDPRVAQAMAANAGGRSSGGGFAIGGDDDMTAIDWVLCILCPGIACIVGIVYLIQGKGKGGKLIMWAFIFGTISNVVGYIIRSAVGGGEE